LRAGEDMANFIFGIMVGSFVTALVTALIRMGVQGDE
jgi:tetrahydromethanopterin S-methyltransferase subunit B